MQRSDYTPPTLTVDTVIFQLVDEQLTVLVVQRAKEPFKDSWALPGGYNSAGETTREAMARILKEKSGIGTTDLNLIEQLYTFDTVARDPRGHAVSVTYMGLGRNIVPTGSAQFIPVTKLPKLAFDHESIIAYAHERLQSKITYTNAVFGLLPKQFTLTHLQSAYETVLGRPLDKRNFRKKFLSLNLVEATEDIYQGGAHRPARLYKFSQDSLQILTRSFD